MCLNVPIMMGVVLHAGACRVLIIGKSIGSERNSEFTKKLSSLNRRTDLHIQKSKHGKENVRPTKRQKKDIQNYPDLGLSSYIYMADRLLDSRVISKPTSHVPST